MILSRKRPWVLMGLVVFFVALLGPTAHGQGLFGAGLPVLPFIGGSSGNTCGITSNCADKAACPGGLTVDVSYLFGSRGLYMAQSFNGGSFYNGYFRENTFKSPLDGVLLGATLTAPLKDDFGIILRGDWLFPSNGRASMEYPTANNNALYSRTWSTNVQNYRLEAAGVYPLCAPLNFLAGFRWDNLSVKLKNPRNGSTYAGGIVDVWYPGDKSDITINSYIPFVGLAINAGKALKVSAIGFPIFWGDVRYREAFTTTYTGLNQSNSFQYQTNFKNAAYFSELGAEYGLPMGPGTLAVFVKWTYMRSQGSPTMKDKPAYYGGIESKSNLDMTVVRNQFYLGGTINLPFISPL